MLDFALALGAMLCFALQNFLYDVAGKVNLSSADIALIQMLTVALISLIFIALNGFALSQELLLFAFLNSLTFVGSVISRIEALKLVPGSVVFTVPRFSSILVA